MRFSSASAVIAAAFLIGSVASAQDERLSMGFVARAGSPGFLNRPRLERQILLIEAEVVAELVQDGFANLSHDLLPRAGDA